jgi:hypothetical protein
LIFDDDIIIVSKVVSTKINFVLQDMGAGSINGKMSKNPPKDKKKPIILYKNDHL